MKRSFLVLIAGLPLWLAGCNDDSLPSVVVPDGYVSDGTEPDRPAIVADTLYNREAVIPPQCYTKTEGVNNP